MNNFHYIFIQDLSIHVLEEQQFKCLWWVLSVCAIIEGSSATIACNYYIIENQLDVLRIFFLDDDDLKLYLNKNLIMANMTHIVQMVPILELYVTRMSLL